MRKIFTTGYERRNLKRFTDLLKENGVDTVVDVRAVPYSRRGEFSKNKLAPELNESRIEYIHMGELGSPKELRDKVRADGDYGYFFEQYDKHLQSRTDALWSLQKIAEKKNVCLLCYEADVNFCHRRSVAARLGKMIDRLEVIDL